jgi:hypothetical protein
MRANQTARPSRPGRSKRVRLAGVMLAAAVLPACTGDNLFTGVGASVGLLGPEVEITAPAENFTMAVGDSVQVTAIVSSPNGVSSVTYNGLFSGGAVAFTQISFTLPNPQDSTVSRFMRQAGATTGNVQIIVEATDLLGATGADTVTVIIS